MDLASPDRYLHSFDGDAAVIVPMDRAAYHRSIFLDGRISPAAGVAETVPVAGLTVPTGPGPAWIFHVAHCGSTLLARALDDPAGEVVLREPLALRQLAVAAVNGHPDPARLALAARLCGRRYGNGLRALVKANVPVNFILTDLLATDPAAPAILLYFALEPYLAAILRGPNHRAWVRHITTELRPALEQWAGPLDGGDARPGPKGGSEPRGPGSDAELAAWLWLAQMRVFAEALTRFPNVRSLDAETFFARPRDTVAAAHAVFNRPVTNAALDAIIAGPLFATYSKRPDVAFDNADRLARQAVSAAALAPEIAAARAWVGRRAAAFPIVERLAKGLL